MVTFNLEDKEYSIPSSMTIDQWSRAIKFDMSEPLYWPHIVNAVTGAPLSTLKRVSEDSLELAIVFIAQQMNEREEVDMMNLENMTFGQWVDLDVYSSLGIDKHFKDMLDILAPTADTAAQALWVLDKYTQYKKFILNQYKELFGLEDIAPEDTETVDTDPLQAARSWYRIIVDLAGKDVLKLDEVTEQPLKKILNFMALQKEEALKEQERQRQQRLKYDLQRARR